jgi:hypothetical protein
MILPVSLVTMVLAARRAGLREHVRLSPILGAAALMVAIVMAELGRRSIAGL